MFIADVASWISLETCYSIVNCFLSSKSVPLNLCLTLCKAFIAFSLICCLLYDVWTARWGDSSSISLWLCSAISRLSPSIMLPMSYSLIFLLVWELSAGFYSFFSLVNLQLIMGSCANVSKTPYKLSLFSRRIRITFSQVNLNNPYMLGTPMAFCTILVNRKGTFYGNFSLNTAT